MVIASNRIKIKSKFEDRGKACIWLGYAKNHAAGTYHVFNPNTNKVVLT